MGRLPIRSGNGCVILLFRPRHQSSLSSPLICSGLRINFLLRLCIIRTVLKIVLGAIIVIAVIIVIDNSPIFGPPIYWPVLSLWSFAQKYLTPRPESLIIIFCPRMWRNWQTRRLQVPVGFGPWRFDSSHPQFSICSTLFCYPWSYEWPLNDKVEKVFCQIVDYCNSKIIPLVWAWK